MTRIVIAAALASFAAAAAAAPAAHAASPWKALGTTTAPLATDGERLVVTAPDAGRLLVRDDQTGKAWKLTLPAGCKFTGIIGGGSAALECGTHPGEQVVGPAPQPVVIYQPRYRLLGLTSGAVKPVPPLRGDLDPNHSSSPTLVGLGSRWASFSSGSYRSASTRLVRLADGREQVDPGSDTGVWPDLASPTDAALQPMCAPMQRPLAANGFMEYNRPPTVVRAGAWMGFADGSRVVAWRCGEPQPVVLASCTSPCPTPQLGGGLGTATTAEGARLTRLRDGRRFDLTLPAQLAPGDRKQVLHTRKYVYAAAEIGAVTGELTIQRRAVPKR